MTKAEMYAEAFARMIVIFAGYLFSWLFFLFTILGSLGQTYLSSLSAFIASTKQRIAVFDQSLKRKA